MIYHEKNAKCLLAIYIIVKQTNWAKKLLSCITYLKSVIYVDAWDI